MSVMRFRRFTKLHVLKRVGRELLGRFFGRLDGANNGKKVELPPASASDDEYFEGVVKVLMSPEGLPGEVGEALYRVDEMANDDGQERLQEAVAARPDLKLDGKLTREEFALEVFLADPKLLAEKHSELKLVRLTTFECYGSKKPVDRTKTFKPPTAEVRAAMAKACDEWFASHNRGKKAARVDFHLIEGEYFFIIRHGDTYIRTTSVDEQKTEALHFRPEKDDVVVYAPDLDEIRIHAGTKGERELYRKEFGLRLFGDDQYFSQRKAYTLEPLRTAKADALEVEGVGGGLVRVVLREYEVVFDSGFDEVLIRKATDIFGAAADKPVKRDAIPAGGRLVRAAFDLYFDGENKPRKVQIRTPNTLKIGRHCETRVVERWLAKRGFRALVDDGPGTEGKRGWKLTVGGRVISEAGRREPVAGNQ